MDEPVIRAREMWPPGTVVREDYVIERRLSQGGFGTIYLARHRFLQSLHVIKRLHEQYASDESYVRKFIREGQAVRRLRGCPHIIEIEHMTQTADGHLLLVMEYLPDGDLETLIKTHGTRAVAEAVDLAVQIAKALEAAHAVGLIHRDIKPLNVLLSRRADGSLLAKVIDFGIAADHTSQHSTSRMVMGSLGYTSPEQWLNPGKHLDGRADLYSLGATLYRMLTGQTPIPAENEMMWLANARTVPPPPSKWQAGVAPELDRLVLQLLAYDRENRPPNATSTIAALQEILKPKQAPPEPVPAKPDLEIKPTPPVERRRVWLAVPVLVVAALVGWIGWRAGQPSEVTTRVEPTQAPTPTPKPTPAPTPPPVDHIAQGDAARDRGDHRAAMNLYRQSNDARRQQRLTQLQRAVESEVEERVATFSDQGQFAQAESLVNSWLGDFPGSLRLQKQKAVIVRRRETE